MKKVLVLGSLGMAGHVIYSYFNDLEDYDVYGVARVAGAQVDYILDVTNFDALKNLIINLEPDVVVNCVGVLVSDSNNHLSNSILINSYLPNYLANLGKDYKYKLVHLSTDCVFSGNQGGYQESSFKDGDDNYARSKSLGEIDQEEHITLRTSIIGPELKSDGVGLMHWFFNQTEAISGYTQAFWSGLTTLELAKVTHFCLTENLSGLIHSCSSSKISKYDLLCIINQLWDKKISIMQNDHYRVDKSLICTRDDFTYSVPSYREMLIDMKVWMEANKSLYSHYNF